MRGRPIDSPQPEKVSGYAQLLSRFPSEDVADRLLAKWLSDPDSTGLWAELLDAVNFSEGNIWDIEAEEKERDERGRHDGLTMKQAIIVWHVGNGHTNAEVALHCNCGEETIKQQIKNIHRKWHTKNRTHLAAEGIRRGVVP